MIQAPYVIKDLEAIRKTSPLVHNITNYVVMNNTANALLSLGASPVMAHAKEEVQDMVKLAQALVINIGTLSPKWVDAMEAAMVYAKQHNIPIILDPVGAGATPYRNEVCERLITQGKPDIIRGNASEILALNKVSHDTRGVDSMHESTDALDAARELAAAHQAVVVISGVTDFITDGNLVISNPYGHPLMAKVTGMGCTATAIIGAFSGVNPNRTLAAAHAMAVMGICGDMAAETAEGPGTLQMYMLDALFQIDADEIEHRMLQPLMV